MIKLEYATEKKLSNAYRYRNMIIYYLIRAKSYLELRLLNINNFLSQKLSRYQMEIINGKQYREKQRVVFRTIGNLPYQVFSFALNAYFFYFALARIITIGTSQIYIRAVATFSDNFGSLVSSILEFYENYLYVSDLTWFLSLQPSRELDVGHNFPEKLQTGITFDHVWFKYPGVDTWILQDVNFTVSPTENIALVGENGAGKTTLVKLLAGFYLPTQGRILIDGIPVDEYSRSSYWRRLAVFFQEFETYDFNARESIAYGNLEKIDDVAEVSRFAKMTDIDPWINSLGAKYEHPLSRNYEKGVSPSTGQWQRIALTRTLIKDSAILILDEPTSNVDPQAEENIFNEVLDLGKNKILIFISHRFSTVRRADRIFVLEKGTVVEQGSHEELLKKKGQYAHLFRLQAKNYQ
jgi:ABC-type multidrug transport system fused ATPase/permease subunit